jgi:hypothetical protein
MENKNNISESLVDRLNGMRSFFNKKEKKNDNSVDLNTNDVKSNSRTDKAKGAVTNNAFYTTIHEGQIKPLKKGEGLANIFARIYNLMKLQNEEEKRHYELERNFQKRQSKGFTPFMREKKDLTVSKEDKKDDKDKNASLMGKMFGLIFKGIKTIVGGMIGVITSSVGFLAITVFSLAKVAAKIIGFIPSILSITGSIMGMVTGVVTKVVGKVISGAISEVMSLVYRGIMYVVEKIAAYFGNRLIGFTSAIGGPLAAVLGVTAAVAGGVYVSKKIDDLSQYALESAFTQDRKGGPKEKLEEAVREREDKLNKLEEKYRNPFGGFAGGPEYEKERKQIRDEYEERRRDIQRNQDLHFREDVEPKLKEQGYTVDYDKTYLPKGEEGLTFFTKEGDKELNRLSIPRIFKNGVPLTDLEMAALASQMAIEKSITNRAKDATAEFKSSLEENPLYTNIKKDVADAQSFLESLKTKTTAGLESSTNTMGEEFDKLMKEFNIGKDSYDMLPPIVMEETHNYNSKGEETGTVIDYSAPVRTDDGTLKRLQEKNLRPF